MDWQPDPGIEATLNAGTPSKHAVEWRQVKDYLTASFAAHLAQDVEHVWEPLYEDISPTWGFAFGIKSRTPLGGRLSLEWYAVISHNSRGQTVAIVLLFAHDQRAVHFENREYLYFEYAPTVSGLREWQSRGWHSSEVHEWDGYLRLSQICEQKRDELSRDRNDA
jgi:hypothetical protein